MNKPRKKHEIGLAIGLSFTLLFALLLYFRFTPLEMLEAKLHDYRFKLRGAIKPSKETVVIAAIDDESLEKLGRWPWNRDRIAQLVDKLNEMGAELIVFDIILSESERFDPVLAQSIQNAGNVLLPVVFDFAKAKEPVLNEYLESSRYMNIRNQERFQQYSPLTAKSVLIPVDRLAREAMSFGHINILPDKDGTVRWESLIANYDGYLYPAISLQTAGKYLGVPPDKIVVDATQTIDVGKRRIDTDKWGRALINYYGPENTFRHIPISKILNGDVPRNQIGGMIVLVGATAVGIYDLRVTPFSPAMPGIEKHASVIMSIIDNKLMREATPLMNFAVLILVGVLYTLIIARLSAATSSIVTLVTLGSIFLGGHYLFSEKLISLNITYPFTNVVVIFGSLMSYHFAVEQKYARKVRAMFSSYLTEKLVTELINNPDMAKLGGERREITVLFSDIRGFTSLSEKHTPEEIVSQLNEYLSEMTRIVFKNDGVLDKFVGDMIVAFWGAPLKQDNHAELAIRCALHMQKRLVELQDKWRADGKIIFDNGIGLNTGEAIVGNIGAEGQKMDYTVIGDSVNLGSRAESLTRKYDSHIIITEFTVNKIRDAIASGKLGHLGITGLANVAVKGKEHPVQIFDLRSLPEKEPSFITECTSEVSVLHEK